MDRSAGMATDLGYLQISEGYPETAIAGAGNVRDGVSPQSRSCQQPCIDGAGGGIDIKAHQLAAGVPVPHGGEGVIKADDEASLRLELEEYVITNEVEKRLEHFLDAYNNYETANGVWISGFFGSGKSHLLKMLALVLENRQVDGVPALDIFLEKTAGNEILRGDLKRAVAIPSKSILFNIDQKADVISKTQVDALLSVFQKVFDEMCGYYGKQGHIAQFERDLDSRGIYTAFKDSYARIAGKPRERGREQALLEGPSIANAYAEASGADAASAEGILGKYRSDHKVSIEDFAQQVKDYIDRQGPAFRLTSSSTSSGSISPTTSS